jgi:hypothetical protein
MYCLDRSTHVTVGVKGPRGCVARGSIWQRSTQARQRTDSLERETTVADICGLGSSTPRRIVCGSCVCCLCVCVCGTVKLVAQSSLHGERGEHVPLWCV